MATVKPCIKTIIKTYAKLAEWKDPIIPPDVRVFGLSPITKRVPNEFTCAEFASTCPAIFCFDNCADTMIVEPKVVIVDGKVYRLPVSAW